MIIRWHGHKLHISSSEKSEYPKLSIAIAVMLLYLSPFVSTWLSAVSFVICLYRVLRYDVRIFATDYCILIPISALTKLNGGVALQIYLCLLAGIIYVLKNGLRMNGAFVVLFFILGYLILRMQMNINDFVLCFGQLFVLYVLLPRQDEISAERSVKEFCKSLLLSSTYAFLLRNTYPLRRLTGFASSAIIGTNVVRFCGLFSDPNFYMTFLVVALALLLKLKDSGRIQNSHFWLQSGLTIFFGILTYSKMFFLMFVFLVGIFVLWQYWNRKFFRGLGFTLLAVVAMVAVLTMENSPFAVVLYRLTSARNFNELTTSRANVFMLYLAEITDSFQNFFLGKGFAAEALYRDPHNLYLEIAYYSGVIGLMLIMVFLFAMLKVMIRRTAGAPKQNLIAKYLVFAVVMCLYLSLNGMFMQTFYAALFLAYLSVLLTKKQYE